MDELFFEYHFWFDGLNFGWGKDENGSNVYHPIEMWLYTYQGADQDEWHKETPIKVVFPLNCKVDGDLPRDQLPLLQWIARKGHVVTPLAHPDFESYEGPLPLELAKQWDLRTLSVYLRDYLYQDEIDRLYPEPQKAVGDDNSDSDSDSDGDDSD